MSAQSIIVSKARCNWSLWSPVLLSGEAVNPINRALSLEFSRKLSIIALYPLPFGDILCASSTITKSAIGIASAIISFARIFVDSKIS